MKPTHVTVPVTKHDIDCGHRSPTGRPCRRPVQHTGRHAFIWRHLKPGVVREVWS